MAHPHTNNFRPAWHGYRDYAVEDDRILEVSRWSTASALGERIFEALAVVAGFGLVIWFIIWFSGAL